MTTALTSVLLGVVGMLGWGVYDFLGGVLAKRVGAFAPLLWSQVFGAGTVLALAVPLVAWGDVGASAVALGVLAAALYCAGYLFFFSGFEQGEVSVVAAVMNLWAVVTMLVAFTVVGQRLSTTQTLGAAAIIAGAMLASVDLAAVRSGGARLSAGTPQTVAGAVCFGLYWNVSEVVSEDVGWLATTAVVKVGVVVLLLALSRLRGRPAPSGGTGRLWFTLAVMGVVEVCAVAAVNYGIAIGDAILVTPVASALSVVTIGLAIVVLRERISASQTAGVLLAVAGIVTTAL